MYESSSASMETLSQLIRRAIKEGAGLFNDGKRKECYELYMNAIDAALAQPVLAESAVGEMLAQASREASQIVEKKVHSPKAAKPKGKTSFRSKSGRDEKSAYGEAAWVLRHCFDEILSREDDRSLMLRGGKERSGGPGRSGGSFTSDNTLGGEGEWQDEKTGNKTDFEKGQALADTAYVLRASVAPKQHTRYSETYDDCFEALEAVEVLTSLGLGSSRGEAVEKCTALLRAGLIVPVSHPEDVEEFQDGTRLYRFPDRNGVQAAMDEVLLHEETKIDGTEKHVAMVALQTTLEIPGDDSSVASGKGTDPMGGNSGPAAFSGVDARLVLPRPASLRTSPGNHARGNELAECAAIVETTVDIADRTYRLKTYERCFVGKEAVDALVSKGVALDRDEAMKILADLVRYRLVHHVTGEHEFKDKYLFYSFSTALEIKEALDEASAAFVNGIDNDDNAVRCAALGCRYQRLTGLNITSILNDFYGCEDESGWDISDLDNWRGNMKRWGFGRREDQDDAMVGRLAPLALNVDPAKWDKTDDEEWESPWGILAQIAIFDQIPRSAFRGTPEAFKWDDLAIRATKRALEKGYFETAYKSTLNQFVLLLPLEHSESWEDQKLGVTLLLRMLSTVAVEDEGYSDYEIVKRLEFSKRLTTAFLEHAQVIAKFKRYPHRNKAIGRGTKLEERIWLASDLVPRWAKSQNPEGEGEKNVVKVPVIPLKRLTRGK